MKIYDISLPITQTLLTWPGDPAVSFAEKCSINNGDICNVTEITMGVHTGTHIDAPYHFINDGKKVHEIDLTTLLGKCIVVEVESSEYIMKKDIEHIDFQTYKKVLFKTKNSEQFKNDLTSFNKKFISLHEDTTDYLVEKQIELIGIDYLSIEGFYSKSAYVHKTLLSNNIVVLEGLNLSDIVPMEYEIICLPIKLVGCDGAPVRVILKTE